MAKKQPGQKEAARAWPSGWGRDFAVILIWSEAGKCLLRSGCHAGCPYLFLEEKIGLGDDPFQQGPKTGKLGFPERFNFFPYLEICDSRLLQALMVTLTMEVAL